MKKELINTLKKFNGVQFISISNYTNKNGEVSNVLLNIGASLHKAKKKDVYKLENTVFNDPLKEIAKNEIINSLKAPLKKRSESQKDAYINICNGLRMHINTGKLYIYGLQVKKKILVRGEYPTVRNKPLTIAKNELKKGLKSSKFRQYELSNIVNISIDGNKLKLN